MLVDGRSGRYRAELLLLERQPGLLMPHTPILKWSLYQESHLPVPTSRDYTRYKLAHALYILERKATRFKDFTEVNQAICKANKKWKGATFYIYLP